MNLRFVIAEVRMNSTFAGVLTNDGPRTQAEGWVGGFASHLALRLVIGPGVRCTVGSACKRPVRAYQQRRCITESLWAAVGDSTNNEPPVGVTPISHMDDICDWETYVCVDESLREGVRTTAWSRVAP